MKSPFLYILLSAVLLAGCSSERAPEFANSEQAKNLVPYALDEVNKELTNSFGTPSELVVWQDLEIDFGKYTGTAGKAAPRPGQIRVELLPDSELASDDRLSELAGSAVILGDGEKVLRVADYDQEKGSLSVLDETGEPATVSVKEGDQITVVGDVLQHGRNLYLRHCMHCHGVSGDGAGPTAQYFNVKPRDYRLGKYKFTSTKTGMRPSRDDLFRIVKLGVPGTYMPSFMLLPDSETDVIVEYIRWLSMRGEMEGKLTAFFSSSFSLERLEGDESEEDVRKQFDEELEFLPDSAKEYGEDLQFDWSRAEEAENVVLPTVPRVTPDEASIARGRALFMNKDKGNCFSCHGEKARGNGPSTEIRNKKPGSEELAPEPGLFDDWGNKVKPRNLTLGIYRGGRRPIDIYRRIHTGIKGTPMQGFGNTLKEDVDKGTSEVWDIVNYVLSIPLDSGSGH